jgi:c-di-GMP-binding flagellar brake protein YcgR
MHLPNITLSNMLTVGIIYKIKLYGSNCITVTLMPKEKYFVDRDRYVRIDIRVHIYITIDQKNSLNPEDKNHKSDI